MSATVHPRRQRAAHPYRARWALFVSYALEPLVAWLERHRRHQRMGHMLAVIKSVADHTARLKPLARLMAQ